MQHPLSRATILCGLLLLAVSSVSGCSGASDTSGSNAGPGAASRPGSGDRPQLPPAPVAVTEAVLGEIANSYSATATLEAEADALILARVAGVVEGLSAEEGDHVREGQALLQIDNDEYRLRLEQAQARSRNLQSRFDRTKGMVDRQLVSEEEFETVSSDLADAKAAEGLAELELGYCRVPSPFDGRVVERLVDPGQTVAVGTPLFRVADFHPLLAKVHVPAKEFLQLEVDQPVRLVLDSSGAQLDARVQRVSPIIDSNSGTIKITIEIDEYPEGTRPGDFAQVRIVTERRENRVLLPSIAVITDKGEQVVYVADEGRAQRRVVDTGFRTDRMTEISSGVAAGEAVVTKGQRSLRNGAPLRILEGPGAEVEAVATADSTRAERTRRPRGRGKRQG